MVDVHLQNKSIPVKGIENLLVQGQTGVEGIRFMVPAVVNGQDLTNASYSWYLQYRNKNKEGEPVLLSKEISGDTITLTWVPNALATQESGKLEIQLYAAIVSDGVVDKKWVSLPSIVYVAENLNPQDITQTDPTAYEQFQANLQGISDEAIAARDKAEKWAEEDEDVEVESEKYSAKHHAAKAATSATQAETARDVALAKAGEISASVNQIAANKAAIEALSMDKDVVGLKYNKTTKVYTRLGAAASWSASACQGSYDENVTSDFDAYPLYAGRKLIKANDDFTEVYEQGDDGYDDFDGDEYVRQPVGWFKDYEDDVERIVLLSAYPKSGFKVHPRFLDKNGNILPYADLGRFEGSVVSGKMYSKADLPPTNNISIGSANAAARAKSTSEIFTLRTVYDWDFDALMAAVEFGTFNLQSVIGRGMVDFSISNSNTTTLASPTANTFITTPAIMAQFAVGDYVQLGSSYGSGSVADGRKILSIEDYDGTNVIVTFDGDTVASVGAGVVITYDAQPVSGDLKNALGMKSGYVGTNGKSHVAYRGAWDLWSESWEMLDMIIKYDNTIYLGKDPQTAHSYYSNPGASGSTYESTGFVTLQTSGYVSAMKRITAEGSKFSTSMTYALGGDSSNGYADYYYDSNGAGAARMVLAGGYRGNGSNAGVFYLGLNCAVGGSDWGIVGRLSHHKA